MKSHCSIKHSQTIILSVVVVVACEYAVVLPLELSAETTWICAEGVIRESVDCQCFVFFFWKRLSHSPLLRSPPGTVLEGLQLFIHSGPLNHKSCRSSLWWRSGRKSKTKSSAQMFWGFLSWKEQLRPTRPHLAGSSPRTESWLCSSVPKLNVR